ncbi:Cleft lip and palate transmembrane protein 1-like protein [Smittium culicis]|uniref:Cleft lip and palate transmembrane protein 1-like protein n=1 Tax=Smittium culicis TaxID=133412 RepID=A0A1R1YRG8_9FUNG|nr:Cleft lip and palate transmembrane protein 1-like protein [Smittium culicis]
MGLINKLITFGTLLFGSWMLFNILSLVVSLYYPNLHIPYIYTVPDKIRRLPKHQIAWPLSHPYIVSSYLSAENQISSYDFFNAAKLVFRSPELISDKGSIVYADSSDPKKKSIDFIQETIKIDLPQSFYHNNGSVFYIHTIVHSKNAIISVPTDSGEKKILDFSDPLLLANVASIIKYQPRVIDNRVQLLKKKSQDPSESVNSKRSNKKNNVYIPHIKKNVDLEIVLERHEFPRYYFPSEIRGIIRLLNPEKQQDPNRPQKYLPIFWENPIAAREEHFIPVIDEDDTKLNSKNKSFDVNIKFRVVQLGWVRLTLKLLDSFRILSTPGSPLQLPKAEIDNIKQMIYDSNPKILLLTFIASILHMVFEFLAYKEDISFYATKPKETIESDSKPITDTNKISESLPSEKSAESDKNQKASEIDDDDEDSDEVDAGQFDSVSRSAVLMRAFATFIGCLYLWDQRENASFLIVIGSVVGVFVETWKLFKIFNIFPFSSSPKTTTSTSTESIKDQADKSGANSLDNEKENDGLRKIIRSSDNIVTKKENTKSNPIIKSVSKEVEIRNKVDRQTGQLMVYIGVPLTIIYGIYSLINGKHTSYTSYLVHTALSSLYLLEFIQMFPQLLINYYLQSVESLPLNAFCYRFLTTFIDDLFAMVIPMPMLTRLGTFRDDIVFFALCYQWWKYPKRSKKQRKQKKE